MRTSFPVPFAAHFSSSARLLPARFSARRLTAPRPAWAPSRASTGEPMSEAQRYESVDVEAADGLIQSKGYTLLDVRTPEEFQAGHAPGALNIPFMVQGPNGRTHNPQFMEQVRSAFPDPEEARLCVACGGGTRGTSAAAAIAEAGYSSVTCMPGGMKAWNARGLPTTAAESGKL